jgi:hypothetical protein
MCVRRCRRALVGDPGDRRLPRFERAHRVRVGPPRQRRDPYTNTVYDADPAWAPHGTRIAYALLCFASDRKGGPPHVVKGMLAETRVR